MRMAGIRKRKTDISIRLSMKRYATRSEKVRCLLLSMMYRAITRDTKLQSDIMAIYMLD